MNNIYGNYNNLMLVDIKDISVMSIMGSNTRLILKEGCKPYSITEVPNTLNPELNEEKSEGGSLYKVNLKCKVSECSPEKELHLQKLSKKRFVAVFNSRKGKQVCLGSHKIGLSFNFAQGNGFDGYQCTVSGYSLRSHLFVTNNI